MKRALFSFILALLPAPAVAQDARDFASGCADDSGGDRCSEAAVKAWQDLYSLSPIEKMAQDGATVRRVLYVDGYGNDWLAISAIRAKGARPILELRTPRRDGQAATTRQSAISEAVWDDILADAEAAHRRYRDEPEPDGGEISICLHGSVSRVESADPRRLATNVLGQLWLDATSRGTTSSACQANPASKFARHLAQAAVRSFPECAALDIDGKRDLVTLLETCLRLSGDLIAAGHARRAMDEWTWSLAQRKSMTGWSRDLRGNPRFASATFRAAEHIDWAALEAAFVGAGNIFVKIEQSHGVDSQHVRQVAIASWYPETTGDDEPPRISRRMEIDWIEQAGNWLIEDIRLQN
jgi:hypothetical protein